MIEAGLPHHYCLAFNLIMNVLFTLWPFQLNDIVCKSFLQVNRFEKTLLPLFTEMGQEIKFNQTWLTNLDKKFA